MIDKPKVVKNPAFRLMVESEDGYLYRGIDGLTVIQSTAIEADGNVWLHTSMSRKSRMPTYDDMARVKRIFIGDDQKAIMVFPDRDHHVNIHPFCLHFYTALFHEPLPEFSFGGSI